MYIYVDLVSSGSETLFIGMCLLTSGDVIPSAHAHNALIEGAENVVLSGWLDKQRL